MHTVASVHLIVFKLRTLVLLPTYCYPHLTEKEIKVQRLKIICQGHMLLRVGPSRSGFAYHPKLFPDAVRT